MKVSQEKPVELIGYLKGRSGVASKGKVDAKTTEVSTTKDMIEVSDEARILKKAKDAVDASPDVREEMVSELKSKIDRGSYNVSGEAIAEEIIKKSIVDIVL